MKCFPSVVHVLAVAALATPAFCAVPKATAAWQNLPLRFEQNRGQAPGPVKFLAHSGEYQVSLLPDAAVVQSPDGRSVRVRFPGAKPATMSGQDRWAAPVQYFRGRDRAKWIADVPQYGRVRYENVYAGTDVVFYGQGRQLEYDFVLRPGADPNRIRVQFDGADALNVTAAGDIEVRTGDDVLVQKKPVVYQLDPVTGQRQAVAGSYRRVDARTVEFALASYDRQKPLVIDPVLSYASYLGGGGTDQITAMAVDQNGIVSVCGYTDSTDFHLSGNNFSSTNKGSRDLFVAKLDPTKAGGDALLYLSYLGGTGRDEPRDIAVDQNGVLYLTGLTTSGDFPRSGYFLSPPLAGGQDAFAMKLDTSLQGTDALAYSTYLGGGATEIGYGVAVDSTGAIYVTGVTNSDDFPMAGNSFQGGRSSSTQEAFVAKLDPSQTSSLVYSTFFGGGGADEGRSIVVEPGGIITVAGTTGSAELSVTGDAPQLVYRGGSDLFVARFDPSKGGNANLVYSTFLGGGGRDEARKIRRTADGKFLLTGFTLSSDFPLAGNAAQGGQGGNGDAFVIRLNPRVAGQAGLEYSTYLGGADAEVAYDVAGAADGSIWVTGYTLSSNFPVQSPLDAGRVYLGAIDGFVTRLGPSGQIAFSTYLGGTSVDVATALGLRPDGSAVVAGYTSSGSAATGVAFPSTPNALQVSNNSTTGAADGFVTVIQP